MISVLLATTAVMVIAQNPKDPYPQQEEVQMGSRYDCSVTPCTVVPNTNPSGLPPLTQVRAVRQGADVPTNALPTFAVFESSTSVNVVSKKGKDPSKEERERIERERPMNAAPPQFWWRYIRGIWPVEQTSRVVAASEGTNVIFASGVDAEGTEILYVIVLPEDDASSGTSSRATVKVTFELDTDTTPPTPSRTTTAKISVDGMPCAELKDDEKRIDRARFRAFIGPETKPRRMFPDDPSTSGEPARSNSDVVSIIKGVFSTAEQDANMRRAVHPPPPPCR